MTGLADNYSVSGSGGAVINHGLYTDTVWAVPVTFKDTAGQAINLAGQPYVAEIVSGSTVIFRFRSSGAAANEGTLGLANAATGVIMFNASIAQHAVVAAGLYRVHLKRDLAEDVWTSEGTILIGKPGAKETYLLFDAPGVESAGALSYAQQAAAAAATAVGAAAAASTDADDAAASATAAASSESAVAASAAAAASSQSAAAASQSAAAGSATAAASSASAAASSEAAADVSEAAASTSATAAAGSATASQNARLASEAARDASVTAKTASESARDAAVVAKTAAETAETNAETAEVAAEAAQAAAEAARNAAQTSATQASTSKDAAAASATAAASSASAASADRVLAETARSGAEAARDAASASAQTATTKAGEALSSANNAAASAAASEASKNAAATSASNIETSYGALGNILDKSAEATAAATVAVSSAQSANLSQLSAAQSALVAAQYSVASGLDTATRNAQAAASLAQGFAASASSVVQQDLSGITAQALHRSPNAITAMVIYDTSKDSDGGAWTEKCQHTSWYNEPLSGKWLGAQESELQARNIGATLGSELIANSDFLTNDLSLWSGTGATLSIVSGQLQVLASTAYGAAFSSAIATVAGTTYALTVKVSTSSPWAAQVGTSQGGGQLGALSSRTSGTFTKYFTATSATTYIRFGCDNLQATLLLDAISFKPVTALNTASNDYFQLTTDGKFYRLWKNILSHTDALDNAAWSKTNATVTPNAATNPLSGLGAEALIEATDTNLAHSVSLTSFVGLTGTYTVSVALKANGRNWAVLNLTNAIGALSTNDIRAWFDLQNGVLGTVTGAGTAAIQSLGGGWYRCSITVTHSILANRRPVIFTSTGDGLYTHNGDGVSGLLIGGFQLEQSATATIYEPKAAEGSTSEVFRGNKADFPRLAAIVAEQSSLTIYDLTEPGRPMWMRFSAVGASNWWRSSTSITAFAIMNGFVVVGTGANYSYRAVDFAKDNLHDAMYAAQPAGGVGARNGAVVNGGPTWVVYGTASVNAIAMTVLPDAPMDPATGLRVPTIAIAISGGVAVIKHNGTVVNSANTLSWQGVHLRPDVLIVRRNESTWFAASPGALGAGFAMSDATPPGDFGGNSTASALVDRSTFSRALSGAVKQMKRHQTNRLAGLSNHIANTFNTGWLPGDIRRAYLSDAEAGTYTPGGELVLNGKFDTDISGWTHNSGVATWQSSGRLRQTDDGVNRGGGSSQTFNTTVGRIYRVSGLMAGRSNTGTTPYVRILSSAGAVLYVQAHTSGFSFTFVATTATTTINLYFDTSVGSNWVEWDDISVTEPVFDRSYKAAVAYGYGTLTRTALATGTSLVGYSGFSTANYLREPYSADLDFGTGEWSCSAWVNVPATLPNESFPAVGSELVTNGDFSSGSTGWTLGDATVAVTGGELVFTASNAVATNAATTYLSGRTHRVTFTISNRTAGGIVVQLSNGVTTPSVTSSAFSSNGTFTIPLLSNGNTTLRVIAQSGTSLTVDNISVREIGPAIIADRAFSSGPRIRLGVTGTGLLTAEAFDGTTTRTVTTSAAYNTASWLKAEACYTTDGTLSIRVNGREVATSRGNPLLTLNNSSAVLTIGNNFATDAPFPGSIALLKLGATVPTYEQSQMMYEQEKQLFRAGAQSVLPDSGSIVDMAYDDATDRWVAISATNESYWTGLVRNSVTPVPAGSYTRVVAGSGLELVARSTTNPGVDVTIPAYGLREELVKRAEAAARLTKEIVTYDYVGGFTANTTSGNTAITNVSTIIYPASYIGARISGSGIPANTTIVAVSGTTIYLSAAATATATGVSISFLDFELPVGMEAKNVMSAGTLRREGSTQDYTRLYDGFIETIRFAVAPGATAWVQIQAQRITLQ